MRTCLFLLFVLYVHCTIAYKHEQVKIDGKTSYASVPNRTELSNADPGRDIPHLAVYMGLTDMESFVYRTSLMDMLSSKGPFTAFSPTNLAFFELSAYWRKTLFLNNTLLKDLLLYHVIKGRLLTTEFSNEQLLSTLLPGHSIRLNIYKDNTVFTVSGAVISRSNQIATNGVIHSLDSVMSKPVGSIYTYIDVTTGFAILRKAIRIADMISLLNGTKPFTMFAPSDAAFSKLSADQLQDLMSDPKRLANVLAYHVIIGTVYTAGFTDQESIQTMNGQNIYIRIINGNIEVNDVELSLPDITVYNGVIHVIDTLMFPPDILLSSH